MGFVLMLGVIFLGMAIITRTQKIGFIFWFPVVATCFIIGILTCNGFPHLQSGPGGLSVLGLIPVFINWLFCGFLVVVCLFIIPKKTTIPVAIGTVAIYAILACWVLDTPSLWGFYSVELRILDWNQKPVVGMTVHSLRQEAVESWSINSMIPVDHGNKAVSDSNGNVKLLANRFQMMVGDINLDNGTEFDKRYGSINLTLLPVQNGKAVFYVEWRNQKQAGADIRRYTTSFHNPPPASCTVFLPNVNQDDTSIYP